MNADLARKRARQQNFPTDPLRLDPSWETNSDLTTLVCSCQTCESLSLRPPWLEQTDEKCAAGKPTDHKGKTREPNGSLCPSRWAPKHGSHGSPRHSPRAHLAWFTMNVITGMFGPHSCLMLASSAPFKPITRNTTHLFAATQ